jgi:hypothetical protein
LRSQEHRLVHFTHLDRNVRFPFSQLILWKPLWKTWDERSKPHGSRILSMFLRVKTGGKKSALAQITGVDIYHS